MWVSLFQDPVEQRWSFLPVEVSVISPKGEPHLGHFSSVMSFRLALINIEVNEDCYLEGLIFGNALSILCVMTKQRGIILAVVVILALLGLFAFSQMKKPISPAGEQSAIQQNSSVPATQESITKGSLRSLIAAGKNVNCEINFPDGNTKGTTFVSGNKMRGDFTVKGPDGKEMASHMINDGTYAYLWTDTVKQGTKMKIDAVKPSVSPAGVQGADLDREVDLKCSPWSVDASKFNIPPDIQFNDVSSMLKNTGASSAPKVDKSICDQIPDAASKAECIKALGN